MKEVSDVDFALQVMKTGEPPELADAAYGYLDNVLSTTRSPALLRDIGHQLLDYIVKGG